MKGVGGLTDYEALHRLVEGIDLIIHWKLYHFEQDDGTWYLRNSGQYVTLEEMVEDVIEGVASLIDE